jgi:endonuclease YncB( thermonuclease family)
MPLLLALLLLVSTTAAAAQTARAIDGDSLEVAGEQIRLIGIDAPEGRQLCQRDGREWRCGDAATAALGELVVGYEVRCDVLGRDRWWRAYRCASPVPSS